MPFLFEPVGGTDELLLPANLLHTDSLVRQMVDNVDEELWQDIEVIGWLYQFYISEKKDQVIGKVVKSEDIPAATQLFTPNWIVKYMVQNSLGAQWMATYPNSPLKSQMEFYIEPAEQTDAVNAQLAAITPDALTPEELTLIDPACGSGHILVEAYDLFKAIYLERGYRQRDVAKLILEKNLFGLDIDERAAQLTGFALMMKGRADDRRLFERGVTLNVMALANSAGFDVERLAGGVELADYGVTLEDLVELKQLFEHATTFGSLIQLPESLADTLHALEQLSEMTSQDWPVTIALHHLRPLIRQSHLLTSTYGTVVANPPYIGRKFHVPVLKKFLKDHYNGYEKDVFSAFIDRNLSFSKPNGRLGFMSPFVWMFISSHEYLRTRLADKETITSLVQLEYSGFDGATVPICTFTLRKGHVDKQKGCYIRLSDFRGSSIQAPKALEAIENRDCGWFFQAAQDDFQKIPGSPVAYWVSQRTRTVFEQGGEFGDLAPVRQGLATADNDQFMRAWPEVSLRKTGFGFSSRDDAAVSGKKWFPYNKGGMFRKWFGNNEYLVNWQDDGRALNAFKPRSVIRNPDFYFRRSLTWSFVSSSFFGVRSSDAGAVFDVGGSSAFPSEDDHLWTAGLLCSKQVFNFMKVMNPTLNFQVGNVSAIPVLRQRILSQKSAIEDLVSVLIQSTRVDWNAYERSWDFQSLPVLASPSNSTPTLESSYANWITQNRTTIAEMKRLEEDNNRLFIDAYGLQDELAPDVPLSQITLTVNPAYRYSKAKLSEADQWTRFRHDTLEELVSYAIGCMMGRYSLDEPGLIYAHSGNEGFDPSRYATFPADDDGIVPLSSTAWFDDDAANRVIEFLSVAWPAEHLEDNLTFLADNLSPKKNETSRETLRRWLRDRFFKYHHLRRYKNRPIYWLFSSGRQKAFQALVYLHRYNEGTLARMRAEYVIPLQGKMAARIDKLQDDVQAATSTAHRKRLEKELSLLSKQQVELLTFDEKLRHYADKRIQLDLDDGVKVNYGKFGDLLAEVRAVHGKVPEGV